MAITAAELNVRITSSGTGKVTGELKGLGEAIKATQSGFNTLYNEVSNFASSAIDKMRRLSDVMGGLALAGGITLIAGGARAAFDQVRAVQSATVALRAYESDAKKVDAVLQDLVAYARSDLGVLFNRTELFAAAQSLRIYGRETDKLAQSVEIMSRSVGLGLSNWTDLSRVIGRVGSTGRLTGIDFDYLTAAGFRLDESLRNTNVTWDTLFAALDQGIPTNALEGQARTIEGILIRLQSAIREIGLQFLGVDPETSQFRPGSLGDRLVDGLQHARTILLELAPAAAAFGTALAGTLAVAGTFVEMVSALPDPILKIGAAALGAVTGLGVLRQSLRAVTMIGGLTGLGRLFSFGGAAAGAGGLAGALKGLVGAINPVTIGLGAMALAGAGVYKIFQNIQKTASSVAQSIGLLNEEVERLLLAGDFATANELEKTVKRIEDMQNRLTGDDWPDLREKLGLDESVRWEDVINPGGLNDQLALAGAQMDDFAAHVIETIGHIADPQAKTAYLEWVNDMLSGVEFTAEGTNLGEIIDQILTTPPTEVPGVLDAIRESAGGAAVESSKLADALERIDHAYAHPEEVLERLDTRYDDLAKRQQDWIAAMLDVTGMGDPLSVWNLAGNATAATALAGALQDTAAAAETAFRVIVGNTDAIKSQADATLKWAENLIAAQGEYSRLDELVEKGLITGASGVFGDDSQYAKAQEAYDRIAGSVERIHDNLDAVQAIQAPLMADLIEQQAAYTDQLRQMPAEQQLITLGWMDATQAGRAMELQTLAVAAASGDLGYNGEKAFTAMIQGAVQADPILKAMLLDIGLISEGANGTIRVDFEGAEAAESAIDRLVTRLEVLIDLLAEHFGIEVEVSGTEDVEAASKAINDIAAGPSKKEFEVHLTGLPGFGGMAESAKSVFDRLVGNDSGAAVEIPASLTLSDDALAGLDGVEVQGELVIDTEDIGPSLPEVEVKAKVVIDPESFGPLQGPGMGDGILPFMDTSITVEAVDSATPILEGVQSAAEAIPTSVTTWTLVAGHVDAIGYLNAVQSAAEAIPESVTTWTLVAGHIDAITQLNAVRAAVEAIPTSVTVAVNAVASSMPTFGAHARGGFVRSDFQLVGEEGPELVQLPYGSYVHTAGETRQMLSTPTNYGFGASAGGSVVIEKGAVVNHIEVHGDDVDEERIAELAGQRTMTALQHIINDHRRVQGVM